MKSFLAAAVTSVTLSVGSLASAAPPYIHHSHLPTYGYPSAGYGNISNFSGYPTYQSSPAYPQYGQSWNAAVYRAPAATYDPVHGDFHTRTPVRQFQSFPQSYGGYPSYGHQHGLSRGW